MKGPRAWTFGIAAVLAAAALGPLVVARDGAAPPREIRLVVRDMRFYLEGQQAPNPPLRLRPGEHVRVVLRNEDPGIGHDFAIASWKVATALVYKAAEETSVTFRVPDRPGTETYMCTPHAEMMRGSIRIE